MSKTLKELVEEFGRDVVEHRVLTMKTNTHALGLIKLDLRQVLKAVYVCDCSAVERYSADGWTQSPVNVGVMSEALTYRITPEWCLPSNNTLGIEPHESDEWFWGEAVWHQEAEAKEARVDILYFTAPGPLRCPAEKMPYVKVEGWRWVGFVYGEREPGEPHSLHPDAWMYVDDDVVCADWSVWRKAGEA
jgi:hypothetical protein